MLLKANSKTMALLGGTVLIRNSSGNYEQKRQHIVFQDGIIKELIPATNSPEADYQTVQKHYGMEIVPIWMDASCIIAPGLLDLHNHYNYNMLPLWSLPASCHGHPWDNRHEWRHTKSIEYQKEIEQFYQFLYQGSDTKKPWGGSKEKAYVLLRFYAELQAISGGTTVLQERNGITTPISGGTKDHLLLRSTGVPTDLGFENTQAVNSITDYFKPDISDIASPYPPLSTGDWQAREAVNSATKKTYFQEYLDLLQLPLNELKRQTGGQLVHLAEGRAGNLLSEQGIDLYSKQEFELMKAKIREIPDYQQKVKASRLTIIHGCGIDLTDQDNIQFLTECEIGLLWSPVSNLLLYSDTPDYYNKVYQNCNVMLGSDWGPSGSKHVWDEARFAYSFLYNRVSDKTHIYHNVLDMVTVNPAHALGINKLGQIKEGNFADFYLLSPNRDLMTDRITPEGILSFTDYHTVGTIINGNLVFGTEKFFSAWGLSGISVSADGAGAEKRLVYVPEGLDINIDEDLADLKRAFDDYSKLIGASIPIKPNKLLSCDDELYNNRIAQLLAQYS